MIRMKKVRKVVIPAAGYGTRFLPATKAQPKEMLPIVDKPIIQYLVEEAVASGITEVIFVTGRGKRAIEDYFDYAYELEQVLVKRGKKELIKTIREISNLASFTYVRQKEPRGNGDALLYAAHLIDNEPCAVSFGDMIADSEKPVIKQLVDIYEKYNAPVVALKKVPKREVHKYGVIRGKEIEKRLYKIDGMAEKPEPEKAPSNLALAGRYIITPEIFQILEKLKKLPKYLKKQELYLTDAFKKLLKTKPIYGLEYEGTMYDCGSKIGFLKTIVDYGLKHKEVKGEFKRYLKNKKI